MAGRTPVPPAAATSVRQGRMYAEGVAVMAGRIRDEDIALVRERTAIADVISRW